MFLPCSSIAFLMTAGVRPRPVRGFSFAVFHQRSCIFAGRAARLVLVPALTAAIVLSSSFGSIPSAISISRYCCSLRVRSSISAAAALSSSRRSLTTTSNFFPASLQAFQGCILLPAHEEYGCCSKFLSASLIVVISNLYCGVVC